MTVLQSDSCMSESTDLKVKWSCHGSELVEIEHPTDIIGKIPPWKNIFV